MCVCVCPFLGFGVMEKIQLPMMSDEERNCVANTNVVGMQSPLLLFHICSVRSAALIIFPSSILKKVPTLICSGHDPRGEIWF